MVLGAFTALTAVSLGGLARYKNATRARRARSRRGAGRRARGRDGGSRRAASASPVGAPFLREGRDIKGVVGRSVTSAGSTRSTRCHGGRHRHPCRRGAGRVRARRRGSHRRRRARRLCREGDRGARRTPDHGRDRQLPLGPRYEPHRRGRGDRGARRRAAAPRRRRVPPRDDRRGRGGARPRSARARATPRSPSSSRAGAVSSPRARDGRATPEQRRTLAEELESGGAGDDPRGSIRAAGLGISLGPTVHVHAILLVRGGPGVRRRREAPQRDP